MTEDQKIKYWIDERTNKHNEIITKALENLQDQLSVLQEQIHVERRNQRNKTAVHSDMINTLRDRIHHAEQRISDQWSDDFFEELAAQVADLDETADRLLSDTQNHRNEIDNHETAIRSHAEMLRQLRT